MMHISGARKCPRAPIDFRDHSQQDRGVEGDVNRETNKRKPHDLGSRDKSMFNEIDVDIIIDCPWKN